jgi:radical SAM protein with 4Fe4S-binding SPASM domain
LSALPLADRRTTYAVWELTLRCNLACGHCGSRAAHPRARELDTAEALDVVAQLAEVGIGEVTLIGGEAFLRRDWLEIARAIHDHGMVCTVTTGGYGIGRELARRMVDARIRQVSVSVDGLEETHDRLRGKKGSWKAALASLAHMREAGMAIACNTQINRLTGPELPAQYALLRAAEIRAWQIQMTVPMGNAADRPEILLQPVELLTLFPMLADLKVQADADGIAILPGNNVGYFGPYDRLLRAHGGSWNVWSGCHAGLNSLGLEADGTIKGCPSLPTAAYTGGNVRTHRLRDVIVDAPELNFNRGGPTDRLWGFCRTCEYAALCRGGCTWTAHVFFGRPGNNPYCHHRALALAERGLRERVALRRSAPGLPFDHGEFDLIEEPLDSPWPAGLRPVWNSQP